MRYDGLILDYGEVLSHPQQDAEMAAMAALLAVDEADLRDAYWRERREYDLGLPATEDWARTLAALDLPAPTSAQRDALIAHDIASWTEYRDDMWAVAAEFRARGGRTAFLSNGVVEIMARIRADRPLTDWFDVVVVSCEVGLAKPDTPIYRACLAELGTPPGRTLFVDDRSDNTEAAGALGIGTLTFSRRHSVGDVRSALGL